MQSQTTVDNDGTAVATPAFEPFSRFYIGWPIRSDTWRDGGAPARTAIINFVSSILAHTKRVHVAITIDDEFARASVEEKLASRLGASARARASILSIPSDDCWMQDIGPIFRRSTDGGLSGVNFRFNAWGGVAGGCYANWARDTSFGGSLLRSVGLPAGRAEEVVLEGGALSHDGRGTTLLTTECALHANRNGTDARARVEQSLHDALGARKVIWLPEGAAFDADTDGHVDNLATFIAPSTVLLLWADEATSPLQHARSRRALEVLSTATDADGRPLIVCTVDAPPPIRRTPEEAVAHSPSAKSRPVGETLCASYVNLVIIESTVFAPRFGVPEADEKAVRQLTEAFKPTGRTVVQVDARELILAGGGLHCISLGQPYS